MSPFGGTRGQLGLREEKARDQGQAGNTWQSPDWHSAIRGGW